MKQHPLLKIEATFTDKFIDGIGWTLLFCLWCFIIFYYSELPDIIPTHYSYKGEVDDFGSKWLIFTMPVIGTILYTVMTMMNKYPHRYNYMTKINEENALRQYTNACRMIRLVKLGVVTVLSAVSVETILIAKQLAHHFKAWFLPLLLVVIFLPIFIFVWKSVRER